VELVEQIRQADKMSSLEFLGYELAQRQLEGLTKVYGPFKGSYAYCVPIIRYCDVDKKCIQEGCVTMFKKVIWSHCGELPKSDKEVEELLRRCDLIE